MSKPPPVESTISPLEEMRDRAATQLGKLRDHAGQYDDMNALEALDELDTSLQDASSEKELGRICEQLETISLRLFQ